MAHPALLPCSTVCSSRPSQAHHPRCPAPRQSASPAGCSDQTARRRHSPRPHRRPAACRDGSSPCQWAMWHVCWAPVPPAVEGSVGASVCLAICMAPGPHMLGCSRHTAARGTAARRGMQYRGAAAPALNSEHRGQARMLSACASSHLTYAAFLGLQVAVTCQPRCLASCTAMPPTPPLPPCTRMRAPGGSLMPSRPCSGDAQSATIPQNVGRHHQVVQYQLRTAGKRRVGGQAGGQAGMQTGRQADGHQVRRLSSQLYLPAAG